MDRPAKDTHSSLFGQFVNYEEKKFCEYGPWGRYYKDFTRKNILLCNEIDCLMHTSLIFEIKKGTQLGGANYGADIR